jgi:VWFA-related protein
MVRRMSAATVLLVVALVDPAAVSPQAAGQRPSFPTETEIVTVDVVVTGREGEPVTGLRREDFAVSEDGVVQEVVSFEAVHRPAPVRAVAPASAPGPRTSSNQTVPGREPASYVVVFDELHLTPAEAVRAREAVASLLADGVSPGDRVGVVGTSQGTRFTARIPEGREALLGLLARLEGKRVGEWMRDYMTDYEAMRIDQDRDPIVTDQVMRRMLSSGDIRRDVSTPREPVNVGDEVQGWRGEAQARAAQVYARALPRLEQTLGIVGRSLEALAEARGRKSLVLVSGGLVQDPRIPGFRNVVTQALRANAVIYSLDARGLLAATSGLQADVAQPLDVLDRSTGAGLSETADASEGSEGLAADTGGFVVKNRNDLGQGLARIARESRSYYLVGYAPKNRAADGRFRRIEVAVAREGARVRARRGYYAPGKDTRAARPPEGRDAALQRALDAPFDLPELPLRAIAQAFGEASPGTTKVLVTLETDIRGLDFAEKGGSARDTLELLLLAVRRDTGESTRVDQQFEMALRPETRARYERTWFPISRELPLAPGPYQAKLVVRDRNSGRLGSLTHEFDVPAPTGLRVSSLVLSDRVREDGGAPGRVPEPVARRSFAAAGLLHCSFEVYGAARDRASGRPNVTAGFAIRREDGRVLAAAPETPMQPRPDGALVRSLGVPLDSAPPGLYEVIVLVTDIASGQAAEAREPILITAPDES